MCDHISDHPPVNPDNPDGEGGGQVDVDQDGEQGGGMVDVEDEKGCCTPPLVPPVLGPWGVEGGMRGRN